jgi:two-component system sensor histidine kinase KdpD
MALHWKFMVKQLSGRWVAYLIGLGLVIVITLFGSLLQGLRMFQPTDADILYILIVAISAAYLGFGPTILVSILSVCTCDFFFITPIFSFTVANEKDVFNLLMLFIVAVAISFLSPRLRR